MEICFQNFTVGLLMSGKKILKSKNKLDNIIFFWVEITIKKKFLKNLLIYGKKFKSNTLN